MKPNQIQKPINKAIDYFSKLRIKEITSAKAFKEKECKTLIQKIDVMFPVAFLLHSLTMAKEKFGEISRQKTVSQKLENELVEFLTAESSNYSFNYWKPLAKLKVQYPLPDDLDDSAVILAALYRAGVDIDERYILKILSLETKPTGPYTTWYLGKNHKEYAKWSDVDAAVNSNLLYLGSLMGLEFKGSEEFIVDKIKSQDYKSVYYPYSLTTLYYFARYVFTIKNESLKDVVKKELGNYSWENLEVAEKIFYLLTKVYIGEDILEEQLEEILKLQSKDGSLPEFPICIDFAYRGKNNTFVGSKVMSTALFLELLTLLPVQVTPDTLSNNPSNTELKQSKQDLLVKSIIDDVILDLKKTEIFNFLAGIFNLNELYQAKSVVIPVSLAFELNPRMPKKIKSDLEYYCKGLLHGWIYYTLLDKIIDGQLDVKYTAVLATLSRLNWEYFYKTSCAGLIVDDLKSAADITNKNYIFEAEKLHYKNRNLTKDDLNLTYEYISNRMYAFAKAISCLPVIVKGFKSDKNIFKIIQNIVLIDQLNDDAHDWEEDLNSSILTFVTAKLLKQTKDKNQMLKLFWEKVMPQIVEECNVLQKETATILKTTQSIFLNTMLTKSFTPINMAKKEIEKSKRIIQYYS